MKKQIALVIVALIALAATSIATARFVPASVSNANFDANLCIYTR